MLLGDWVCAVGTIETLLMSMGAKRYGLVIFRPMVQELLILRFFFIDRNSINWCNKCIYFVKVCYSHSSLYVSYGPKF